MMMGIIQKVVSHLQCKLNYLSVSLGMNLIVTFRGSLVHVTDIPVGAYLKEEMREEPKVPEDTQLENRMIQYARTHHQVTVPGVSEFTYVDYEFDIMSAYIKLFCHSCTQSAIKPICHRADKN